MELKDMFPEYEWKYQMRREMQEIIPGLYLGPYSVASRSKFESLKKAGITDIVCVRHRMETNLIRPNFPDHFRYLVLDISDEETQNIIQFFPQVNNFVGSCLRQGDRVLVHGSNGTSRSAALVIAFIMQHFHTSFKDAYLHLQSRRFCVCLNEGFVNQLEAYESIYKAQQMYSSDQQTAQRGSVKRKWEEEEAEMDLDPSS